MMARGLLASGWLAAAISNIVVGIGGIIAVGLAGAAGGCTRGQADELRELRDEACACKSKACASKVGARLSRAAVAGELDEPRARLALEASHCLASFGE